MIGKSTPEKIDQKNFFSQNSKNWSFDLSETSKNVDLSQKVPNLQSNWNTHFISLKLFKNGVLR